MSLDTINDGISEENSPWADERVITPDVAIAGSAELTPMSETAILHQNANSLNGSKSPEKVPDRARIAYIVQKAREMVEFVMRSAPVEEKKEAVRKMVMDNPKLLL